MTGMVLAALSLLLLLQAPSQEVSIRSHPYIPPPTAPLTAETNLVETRLVVRDNRGNPIGGFHASEFQVLDNGKPQQILSFTESKPVEPDASASSPASNKTGAKPPPAGKMVTLFFDDLHTDTPELMRSIGATRKFITSALKPVDRLAIATSSGSADLDFTSDSAAIEAKLDQVRTHVRQPIASCPVLTAVDAYLFVRNMDGEVKSQVLQDAKNCICGPSSDPNCPNSQATNAAASGVASAAAEAIWNQTELESTLAINAFGDAVRRLAPTRATARIMILISSGFLPPPAGQNNSMLDPVISAALRWNVAIHSLDAKSLDPERERSNGQGLTRTRVDHTQQSRQAALREPLEKIAKGTGGYFFHDTNDLSGALEMAVEPAISYTLAFNPGGRDGEFHNLKIAFKSKVYYSLQFRPGYFSPSDEKKAPPNRAALDAAVFSKQNLREIPAGVTLAAGELKDGTIPVAVEVIVDLNHLEFVASAGRHVQQIVFLTTLLDASDSFVIGKESIMDLSLTDEKLAALKKEGLKVVATLNVPAGIYHVRTVVRESMKGALAASTIPIELRAN